VLKKKKSAKPLGENVEVSTSAVERAGGDNGTEHKAVGNCEE